MTVGVIGVLLLAALAGGGGGGDEEATATPAKLLTLPTVAPTAPATAWECQAYSDEAGDLWRDMFALEGLWDGQVITADEATEMGRVIHSNVDAITVPTCGQKAHGFLVAGTATAHYDGLGGDEWEFTKEQRQRNYAAWVRALEVTK